MLFFTIISFLSSELNYESASFSLSSKDSSSMIVCYYFPATCLNTLVFLSLTGRDISYFFNKKIIENHMENYYIFYDYKYSFNF